MHAMYTYACASYISTYKRICALMHACTVTYINLFGVGVVEPGPHLLVRAIVRPWRVQRYSDMLHIALACLASLANAMQPCAHAIIPMAAK